MCSYLTSTDARQTLRWRRLLTTSKNTEGRFSKQGSPMREELRPRPFGITFFGAKSLGWSVWLWKHWNACITGGHPFLMDIEFSIWSEIKRWWFNFSLNENHWKYNWIVNISNFQISFNTHLFIHILWIIHTICTLQLVICRTFIEEFVCQFRGLAVVEIVRVSSILASTKILVTSSYSKSFETEKKAGKERDFQKCLNSHCQLKSTVYIRISMNLENWWLLDALDYMLNKHCPFDFRLLDQNVLESSPTLVNSYEIIWATIERIFGS